MHPIRRQDQSVVVKSLIRSGESGDRCRWAGPPGETFRFEWTDGTPEVPSRSETPVSKSTEHRFEPRDDDPAAQSLRMPRRSARPPPRTRSMPFASHPSRPAGRRDRGVNAAARFPALPCGSNCRRSGRFGPAARNVMPLLRLSPSPTSSPPCRPNTPDDAVGQWSIRQGNGTASVARWHGCARGLEADRRRPPHEGGCVYREGKPFLFGPL